MEQHQVWIDIIIPFTLISDNASRLCCICNGRSVSNDNLNTHDVESFQKRIRCYNLASKPIYYFCFSCFQNHLHLSKVTSSSSFAKNDNNILMKPLTIQQISVQDDSNTLNCSVIAFQPYVSINFTFTSTISFYQLKIEPQANMIMPQLLPIRSLYSNTIPRAPCIQLYYKIYMQNLLPLILLFDQSTIESIIKDFPSLWMGALDVYIDIILSKAVFSQAKKLYQFLVQSTFIKDNKIMEKWITSLRNELSIFSPSFGYKENEFDMESSYLQTPRSSLCSPRLNQLVINHVSDNEIDAALSLSSIHTTPRSNTPTMNNHTQLLASAIIYQQQQFQSFTPMNSFTLSSRSNTNNQLKSPKVFNWSINPNPPLPPLPSLTFVNQHLQIPDLPSPSNLKPYRELPSPTFLPSISLSTHKEKEQDEEYQNDENSEDSDSESDSESEIVSKYKKTNKRKRYVKKPTSTGGPRKKRIYNELNKMILIPSTYLAVLSFNMGGECFNNIPISSVII